MFWTSMATMVDQQGEHINSSGEQSTRRERKGQPQGCFDIIGLAKGSGL